MRAFVEHRGRYNLFGFNPKFTLYLRLEFSNEERAIVRMRALQNYIFDLSPGYLGRGEQFRLYHASHYRRWRCFVLACAGGEPP